MKKFRKVFSKNLILMPFLIGLMVNTMSELRPEKLHVEFKEGVEVNGPLSPRMYTLTHSDRTGDLFLTIGPEYNRSQISGLYTRLMRDEVLAEWFVEGNDAKLIVHCHVSGGLVFGPAGWRYSIFKQHLPMVISAFRYGDRGLFAAHEGLSKSIVFVHFHAVQERFNIIEDWGPIENY
jgi:hypothetical protein